MNNLFIIVNHNHSNVALLNTSNNNQMLANSQHTDNMLTNNHPKKRTNEINNNIINKKSK